MTTWRLARRLLADARFDVCIGGGVLTSLWTAYSLAKAEPSRASPCSNARSRASARRPQRQLVLGAVPAHPGSLERQHGFDAVAMRRAMVDTVDEVGRVARLEGIDRDWSARKVFARNAVQRDFAKADVAELRRFGVDRPDYWDQRTVGSRELERRVSTATTRVRCSTPPARGCIPRRPCSRASPRWSNGSVSPSSSAPR